MQTALGRNRKVAGYTFMLRRELDGQQNDALPDVQKLRDETRLDNLQRMDITQLLGQRLAFVPVTPATPFNPLVDGWPATGTAWLLKLDSRMRIDAPLLERMGEMKARGGRFSAQQVSDV